jgi:acyl-CoA synthetase (AMP-forming)/AMP-acid ligase II
MRPAAGEDDERSIWDAFEHARTQNGNRPFLHIPAHCAGGLTDLTYDQASARIQRIVEGYRHAGYGAGHHIALMLESRSDSYLHWLAVNAIGATVVPVGADLAHDELTYILHHADVDLIVHLPERAAAAEHAVHSIDGLTHATPEEISGRHAQLARTPRAQIDAPDQAAIVFTSGSTGRPKGCVLSNEYFLSSAAAARCALASSA